MSGARSAPPGQVTVPVSSSTVTAAKPPGVRASFEDGTAHPVKHRDLAGEAVGKTNAKDTVADSDSCGYVGRQADHRSGLIDWSISPARARRQFSLSSS